MILKCKIYEIFSLRNYFSWFQIFLFFFSWLRFLSLFAYMHSKSVLIHLPKSEFEIKCIFKEKNRKNVLHFQIRWCKMWIFPWINLILGFSFSYFVEVYPRILTWQHLIGCHISKTAVVSVLEKPHLAALTVPNKRPKRGVTLHTTSLTYKNQATSSVFLQVSFYSLIQTQTPRRKTWLRLRGKNPAPPKANLLILTYRRWRSATEVSGRDRGVATPRRSEIPLRKRGSG